MQSFKDLPVRVLAKDRAIKEISFLPLLRRIKNHIDERNFYHELIRIGLDCTLRHHDALIVLLDNVFNEVWIHCE